MGIYRLKTQINHISVHDAPTEMAMNWKPILHIIETNQMENCSPSPLLKYKQIDRKIHARWWMCVFELSIQMLAAQNNMDEFALIIQIVANFSV